MLLRSISVPYTQSFSVENIRVWLSSMCTVSYIMRSARFQVQQRVAADTNAFYADTDPQLACLPFLDELVTTGPTFDSKPNYSNLYNP
jgi:hypothetical protein